MTSYTVRSGDTLSGIAQRFDTRPAKESRSGMSGRKLTQLSGKRSSALRPASTVAVPGSNGAPQRGTGNRRHKVEEER